MLASAAEGPFDDDLAAPDFVPVVVAAPRVPRVPGLDGDDPLAMEALRVAAASFWNL